MLTRSRWVSNYYITPATGSSDQLERRCWNENHVPAESGPSGPRLTSPGERERKAVIARRVGGSLCCSLCLVSKSLSHTTLSKKWEVYFSKELCQLVVLCWICFCMHMYYVAMLQKAGSLWGMMRGVGGVRKSEHQSWLTKGLGLGLGLLCWGFKGVQEEISAEEASNSSNRVSGISTRTIHQSTILSLPQTIWARWESKQFLTLPIVQTLLRDFYLFPSSEAVIMRQLRRWKRLWWRSLTHWHKRTSMGPSRSCWNSTTTALQLEEITLKGTRVSCVYY